MPALLCICIQTCYAHCHRNRPHLKQYLCCHFLYSLSRMKRCVLLKVLQTSLYTTNSQLHWVYETDGFPVLRNLRIIREFAAIHIANEMSSSFGFALLTLMTMLAPPKLLISCPPFSAAGYSIYTNKAWY